MKSSKIQIRLTASYLFTTLMVILMFLVLTFGGYFFYLNTNFAAYWAGQQAIADAEELVYWLGGSNELDVEIAQEFVSFAYGDFEYEDHGQIIIVTNTGFELVIDLDGNIVASSNLQVFPLHTNVLDGSIQGVSIQPIQEKIPKVTYYNLGKYHVGQAPILNPNNELIGWLYFKEESENIYDLMQEIVATLTLPALLTILLAMFVSGVIGFLFAYSFTKRIKAIQTVSRDFAAGAYAKRIQVKGNDEFADLSTQFNRMADQIQKQLQDLSTLAETNATLAQEARHLSAVEERNRLARELHDSVKQQLFGVNLMLGSIKTTLGSNAEAAINQVIAQVQDIQKELDHIIKALRPASLQDVGLVAALQALTSRWTAQTNIQVNLQVHAERGLALEIEEGMYRIAQEALQNVMKHADATKVDMTLTFTKHEVLLTISDNGKGFDENAPRNNHQLGLSSMYARAQAINASLSIESQINKGTTLFLKTSI